MAKIYLSSTYSDLVDHREAVYRTLRQMRHDVVAMEDYVATDERPLDKCTADVAACDLYVGIFAWRYGFQPPGKDRSITELELTEAVRHGKPTLIFLLDESAPWPPRQMDADRAAIDRLRSRLQQDHIVDFFSTPDQLATKVSVAVASALDANANGERGAGTGEHDTSRKDYYYAFLSRFTSSLDSQIRFYARFGAVLLTVGVILSGAGFTLMDSDLKVVSLLGGGLIAATTAFPVAVLSNKKKKKLLLDSFEAELAKESPAPEALVAVKSFLDRELNLALEIRT